MFRPPVKEGYTFTEADLKCSEYGASLAEPSTLEDWDIIKVIEDQRKYDTLYKSLVGLLDRSLSPLRGAVG